MSFKKSTLTVIKVDSVDLSAYVDSHDFSHSADLEDVTTYGAAGHAFLATLTNATLSLTGRYDSTATTGPRAVLTDNLGGDAVAVLIQEEGTAASAPQISFNAIVKSYDESGTVGGITKFKSDLQVTGAVSYTAQSA